ncbi:MAG: hypothetical protein ACTHKG_17890 [Nocardioides sp.]
MKGRLRPLVVALVTALAAMAGCTSGTEPADPAGAAVSASVSGSASTAVVAEEERYRGPTIPDGVYRKKITKRQVRTLGIDPAEIASGFSARASALVVYKFAHPAWTQFEGPAEAQLSSGSRGTLRYENGRRLVLSEDCCGDSVLTWRWDGTRLTLKLRSGENGILPMDHLMRDGVYTKVG